MTLLLLQLCMSRFIGMINIIQRLPPSLVCVCLLCRWIAAGAFYTFSRNHNTLGAAPQELYRWPTVAAAARNALALRYRLLPYLYSCFYRVRFVTALCVAACDSRVQRVHVCVCVCVFV